MFNRVSTLPQMLIEAWEFNVVGRVVAPRQVTSIVFCGMGGSAIGGDICRVILEETLPFPVIVNRGYNIPAWVNSGSLVFLVSYSGDTEETIACLNEALKRNAMPICISSNGSLLAMAQSKGLPYVMINKGIQPREAIAYTTIPILKIMEKLGFLEAEKQVREASKVLMELNVSYEEKVKSKLNPARRLAEKLEGTIPIILGSEGLTSAVATRWKTQFNENSKVTAHVSIFPELNHNEIVNLSHLKKGRHPFALIILRDQLDSERIKKRIEITKSLISRVFSGIHEYNSIGQSPLARIFSLVFLGDYTSIYLALLNKVDPTAVEAIQKLKRELKR